MEKKRFERQTTDEFEILRDFKHKGKTKITRDYHSAATQLLGAGATTQPGLGETLPKSPR